MKVWKPLSLAAAVTLAVGCPRDEPQPVGRSQTEAAEPPALDTTPSPTVAAGPPAEPLAARPAPAATRPAAQTMTTARVDQPFETSYTGTVQPGMSEAQVIEVWGQPVARRQEGVFAYLHFRNGCEASCGMYDIVILEGDQVVDAVVRFSGHVYAGVSSSPPGRTPLFTPPDSVRGGADG